MMAIKLLSKNKYLKVPLLFSGSGGSLLPPELQGCEYLETDGFAYINTGLKSTDITTLKCKCFCVGEVNVFGARNTSPYHSFQLGTNASGNYIFIYDNGAGSTQITTSNQSNADILEFEIKDNGKIYFNSVEYSNKKGTYTTNYNIFLFGINSNGNAIVNIHDKIYYWQTNICYLTSCYIKSGQTYTDNKGNDCPEGTCGMYDIVNQVFYTNDGTGQFTHGDDIEI